MTGLMWFKRRGPCAVTTRMYGDWLVLDVQGKFVAGIPEKKLLEAIEKAVAGGARRVVIDLTAALLADESVAQAAPAAYHLARIRGVDLRFVVPPGRAGGFYHMAGLEMHIPTYQRLNGAIEM